MDVFTSALSLLMDWQVLIGLLIGSIGGVIIGAIPGVGAAVAIAILLPATFALPPLVGLVMLLGIYGSSMYGAAPRRSGSSDSRHRWSARSRLYRVC